MNAELAALIDRLKYHRSLHDELAAYDDDARQWAWDLSVAVAALQFMADALDAITAPAPAVRRD